jgi:hypothetical protein
VPADQLKSQRGPRVAATVAEMIGARTQPHQSVGLSAHAIVLKEGEHKEGAARALLECTMTFPHLVPIIDQQARQGDPEIAAMCVEMLRKLVEAGESARAFLDDGDDKDDARGLV